MTAHCVVVTSGPLKRWFWFFTLEPHLFSVYWLSDGTKTMDEFMEEQLAIVRAYVNPTCVT